MGTKRLTRSALLRSVLQRRGSWGRYHDTLTNFRSAYYDGLSIVDKQTWDALTYAAEHQSVAPTIQVLGYGRVLGLLEHMDPDHGNDFMDSLHDVLEQEAAADAAAAAV